MDKQNGDQHHRLAHMNKPALPDSNDQSNFSDGDDT